MKTSPVKAIAVLAFLAALVCAVSGRPSFAWKKGRYAIFAGGCDFYGNDLKTVATLPQNCDIACRRHRGCTHFAWLGNSCFLKGGFAAVYTAIESNKHGAMCGIMHRR